MNLSEYMSEIGKKGGKARLSSMSAEHRRRIARKAAKARWKKVKRAKT